MSGASFTSVCPDAVVAWAKAKQANYPEEELEAMMLKSATWH
jgi:hypothetical protein